MKGFQQMPNSSTKYSEEGQGRMSQNVARCKYLCIQIEKALSNIGFTYCICE